MDLKTAFSAAALAYYQLGDPDVKSTEQLENIHNLISTGQAAGNEDKLSAYLVTLSEAVSFGNPTAIENGLNILKA